MSLLDELLRKARTWCDARPGRRTELAKQLGWRLQELSSYLAQNPARRPNAEKALALSAFLAKQRPQNAPPRSVAAPKVRSSDTPSRHRMRDIYRAALDRKA